MIFIESFLIDNVFFQTFSILKAHFVANFTLSKKISNTFLLILSVQKLRDLSNDFFYHFQNAKWASLRAFKG